MRKTINILWLDDDKQHNCKDLQDYLCDVLAEKGYATKYTTVSSVEEAKSNLENRSKRIDFFVSDFNLGGESDSDGIDFLEMIRKEKKIKQFFILYSHTSKSSLRKSILSKLKKNEKLIDSLTNFAFFSIGDSFKENLIKSDLSKISDLALCRWEELSALRGEYAAINTLADSILESILSFLHAKRGTKNYSDRINRLKAKIQDGTLSKSIDSSEITHIFDKWHNCRKIRNSLEHNSEQWDAINNDFYIVNSEDNSKIYESNVSDNRKRVVEESNSIKRLFIDLVLCNSNLSFLANNPDYLSFIND